MQKLTWKSLPTFSFAAAIVLALAVFSFGGTAYAVESVEEDGLQGTPGLSQELGINQEAGTYGFVSDGVDFVVDEPSNEVDATDNSIQSEMPEGAGEESQLQNEEVGQSSCDGDSSEEGMLNQEIAVNEAEGESMPGEADGDEADTNQVGQDIDQTGEGIVEGVDETKEYVKAVETSGEQAEADKESAQDVQETKPGNTSASVTTSAATSQATTQKAAATTATTTQKAATTTTATSTTASKPNGTASKSDASVNKKTAMSMPAQTFQGSANGVTASVTAPEGAFPKGTKMFVTAVADSEVIDAIESTLEKGKVVKGIAAVDITFKNAKGQEINPLKPISVSLRSSLVQTAKELTVVHIDHSGAATVVANKKTNANTTTLKSERFSAYAVAETGKSTSTTVSTPYFVIVIDPGHGGYDSGASSYVEEKGVNLKIAKYLATELEKLSGVKVYLTRTDDTYVSLDDRVQKAVNWKANLVVSIHNNSGGGTGCEVLVPNSSSWCYQDCYVTGTKLGNNVVAELKKVGLSQHGSGLVYRDCTSGDTYPDGSKADYYTLVSGPREHKILGVIIEHAFVDSYSDSRYLIGDSNLQKLAKADAAGIAKTFNLASVPTNVNSQAAVKTKVVYSAAKTGKEYNYVWRYGTTWDLWGSTVKSTGKRTTATSGSFTPTKTGTYYVWVDVVDASGKMITTRETAVNVWNLSSTAVKTSAIKGTAVKITPNVSGSATGLTYNYCWSVGGKNYSSAYTTATSYSMTPQTVGTYSVWVTAKDAYGKTVSTSKRSVSVWSLSVSIDKTAVGKGETVTLKPVISGKAPGVTYNYAWRLGTTWDTWDSTVKSTGKQTSATSSKVKASKVGTYYLWVDAVDANGNKATSEKKTCISTNDWKLMGTKASGPYYLLAPITFSANVEGCKTDLTYNYVWRYGDTWDTWNSNMKTTGKMTTSTTGSFIPTKAGTYYAWVDVQDKDGNKGTTTAIAIPVSDYKVKVVSSAKTGSAVSFSLESTPSKGVTYNYVWRYGDTWDDWGSTIKSTGSTTSAKSGSFTAKKPGTYYVWVDVKNSGNQVISSTAPVKVTLSWSVTGISAPSSVQALENIKYSANVSGDAGDLTYNYVWRYGETWDIWGSNVKWTGRQTAKKQGATQAAKAGTYYVWVDVKDKYGNAVTTKAAAVTSANYTVRVSSTGKAGDAVSFKVVPTASSGLTYNYAWRYGETWDEWSSTVKSTGTTTAAKYCSFTPTKAGTYYVWADVKDKQGHSVTTNLSRVTLAKSSAGYAIMGSSTVSAAQMVSYYKGTGATYPSGTYSSKGAASINDFANIVLSEAKAEGVKGEVVFAQAMLETGNLKYGGDVSASQCNFAGIGATGGGVKGATFSNVRQGVRAQVQHLKAYASTSSLNNACVDPRFQYVTRGSATTVEALSGKWATSSTYGNSIVTIINKIKAY